MSYRTARNYFRRNAAFAMAGILTLVEAGQARGESGSPGTDSSRATRAFAVDEVARLFAEKKPASHSSYMFRNEADIAFDYELPDLVVSGVSRAEKFRQQFEESREQRMVRLAEFAPQLVAEALIARRNGEAFMTQRAPGSPAGAPSVGTFSAGKLTGIARGKISLRELFRPAGDP